MFNVRFTFEMLGVVSNQILMWLNSPHAFYQVYSGCADLNS